MCKLLITSLLLIGVGACPALAHGRLVSPSSTSNLCPEGQVQHWTGRGIDKRMTCVAKKS